MLEAVELDDAVRFAIVADNGQNQEVADVFVRLYVVRLWLEVLLVRFLKVIVVDCLGLAKGSASETLVGRNTDHLVSVQDHIAHRHV